MYENVYCTMCYSKKFNWKETRNGIFRKLFLYCSCNYYDFCHGGVDPCYKHDNTGIKSLPQTEKDKHRVFKIH